MKRPPNPFADLYRYVPGGGESRGVERCLRFVATALVSYSWHACFVFRLSQWCHLLYLWPMSFVFQRLLLHGYGIDIPPSTTVGSGLWMPHAKNIVVHRKAVIGDECTILHNVTVGGRDYSGYPVIGNQVQLGVSASVLGAIRIGDRVHVGAHALAIQDAPPGTTVVGVPGRVLPNTAPSVTPDPLTSHHIGEHRAQRRNYE